MRWEDLPATIDAWTLKAAAPGYDVRQAAAVVYTDSPVGYYYHPPSDRVGIFAPLASVTDTARVKAACVRATGTDPLFLSYQGLADPDAAWVKVAHSPTLRGAGELLNFFPGQFPGGVPNSPSPVAAMLTSGLLGAGLGWGGGKLLGKLMPHGYGDKLSRTGLILGGALGAAPGAAWAGTNMLSGLPANSDALLNHKADAEPVNYPNAINGINAENATGPGHTPAMGFVERLKEHLHNAPMHRYKISAALDAVELGDRFKQAAEKVANTFGYREDPQPGHPADVNIDHLGRTLWDAGASPALAASTMAGLYAAQQLPDPDSRPGVATGHQLGTLARNAAGDYAKGYLVGAALNRAIGTPLSAHGFGAGSVVLGIVSAVVPKLFGG